MSAISAAMLHSNHPKTQWLKPNVLYPHTHGQWVICNLAGLLAPDSSLSRLQVGF